MKTERTILHEGDQDLLVPITAKTVIERDSLFRGLPAATIERIATLAVRRVHEAGAVIFMRGDALAGYVKRLQSRIGEQEKALSEFELYAEFARVLERPGAGNH